MKKLSVEFRTEGSAAVLMAEGILDEGATFELHRRVGESIATGFRSIVLNLTGVVSMTPDGIMLLEAIRHDVALCDGTLILTVPQADAAEMLKVYGLSDHILIMPTEKEALRRLDNPPPSAWAMA
ncbi:MAG: STAS domain-containing protein [Candidatus Coatesbacteria bacterium]|nr:STAS domain-containing protein [Candidatus Coatesbacteria bacterium]